MILILQVGKTDAQGLDKAYQQGDVSGNNNIGYEAGTHAARDWFDDVAKTPQWQNVPPGLNPIVDVMNTLWGRELIGTGDLRRCQEVLC
jgi:hypothetical protein